MKTLIFLSLIFSSLSLFAQVDDKVCSTQTSVCATIKSDVLFSSSVENRFMLILNSSSQNDEIKLIKLDLWMQMGGHGHGSSPLKITPVSPGEFDVTKAFFMMKGKWQVRVSYQLGESKETLIIPVAITQ